MPMADVRTQPKALSVTATMVLLLTTLEPTVQVGCGFFLVDNLNTICTGKLRFQLMSLIGIVTEVFFSVGNLCTCHTGKMCFSRDVLPRVLRILTLLMLDSFKVECIC